MSNRLRQRLGEHISRRALLRATARAGVGAAALSAVGGSESAFRSETVGAQTRIQRGSTLTFPFIGPYSGDPPTLDPYENLTYRSQIPSGYHYSKLLRPVSAGPGVSPGDQAHYEPDLAVSLPEMPDDTTYVFRLRGDAYYHGVDPLNGRQVTTDDILQSLDRFRWLSANAASWDNRIQGVSAGRNNTLIVRGDRPFAPTINLLGSSQHLWVIPPEIVDDGTVAQRPVGSGAWIFEEFEPGVALTWRRNPNWHNAGPSRLPLADKAVATLNGASDVIISALRDGSLDWSQLTPSLYRSAREAAPQIDFDQYIFTPNSVPGGFFFNFSIPPWNDVRVRIALSRALDRNAILQATDDTGQGAWQSAIAQFEPFWLDPKSLRTFGRTYEGQPSGLNFHRNVLQARQLLDAAGYPDGILARLHGTTAYGSSVTNFYEECAVSAADAGFQFEFFFKEYAAYIASIFRGNFPDIWDGESSHLAIGPMYGGAIDPDDIFTSVYSRDSGRHNWGAAGRRTARLATRFDSGGHASAWTHPHAALGGGPEAEIHSWTR